MFRPLFFAGFTTAVAFFSDEGIEQAALLQGLGRKAIAEDKMTQTQQIAGMEPRAEEEAQEQKTPLLQLFEATSKLLRSGATPDVVTFTTETLEEIKQSVLPAIKSAHKTDVVMLKEAVAAFRPITQTYQRHTRQLVRLRSEDQKLRDGHKECRDEELVACHNATECEVRRQELLSNYTVQRNEYRTAQKAIKNRWCGQNKKDKELSWRTKATSQMEVFMEEGAGFFEAKGTYDDWSKVCRDRNKTRRVTTKRCNNLKVHFEIAACTSADRHSNALQILDSEWKLHADALADMTKVVTKTEKDRKKELTVLRMVQCLLNNIQKRGGKPCDEDSEPGEADAQIQNCHNQDVDTSSLDIDYPKEPTKPDAAAAQPQPCGEDFLLAEYGALTDVCFDELPACQPCGALPPPTLPNASTTKARPRPRRKAKTGKTSTARSKPRTGRKATTGKASTPKAKKSEASTPDKEIELLQIGGGNVVDETKSEEAQPPMVSVDDAVPLNDIDDKLPTAVA